MRPIFLISLTAAAAFLLAGCTGGSSNSTSPASNTTWNSSSSSPVVQPEVFAQRKVDVANLNQAVQQFNAAEGHYPQTLQDLAPNYIERIPQPPTGCKIIYDPNSGAVSIAQQ